MFFNCKLLSSAIFQTDSELKRIESNVFLSSRVRWEDRFSNKKKPRDGMNIWNIHVLISCGYQWRDSRFECHRRSFFGVSTARLSRKTIIPGPWNWEEKKSRALAKSTFGRFGTSFMWWDAISESTLFEQHSPALSRLPVRETPNLARESTVSEIDHWFRKTISRRNRLDWNASNDQYCFNFDNRGHVWSPSIIDVKSATTKL
jgi:hypothetical protein